MKRQADGYEVDARKARGDPLPTWFIEEPPLEPGDWFFLDAFFRLGTCRQVGYQLGPIPWTAVQEYARLKCLDRDAALVLEHVLAEMDAAHAEWCKERGDAQRRVNQSAAKAGS